MAADRIEDGVIDPQVYDALKKQGVIKEKTRNLNDVKTLRSRVLQEIPQRQQV